MADDVDPFDKPAIYCRHLLICRTLWYDPERSDSFSLAGIIVNISPPSGSDGYFL